MEEFEAFAGYHENIIAVKGELTGYFSTWQEYGEFSTKEIEQFYFDSEASCVFTKQAFDKLKNILLLDEDCEDLILYKEN